MCTNNLLYYKKFFIQTNIKIKNTYINCIYPITINVSFTVIDYNSLHLNK